MTTVTPSGDPPWARTASHDIYGGHENKTNYQSQTAINPKTDVTAEQFCRIVEDLAACVRVATFSRFGITCNDSGTPAAPTVNWAWLMNGTTTSYAGDSPPTGFPAAARVSDGAITITFAASYADAYGVSQAFVPAQVEAFGNDATVAYVTYSISGQIVTLEAFDDAGAAVQDAEFTVWVT